MEIFGYSIYWLYWTDIWMLGTAILCLLVMLDDMFVDVLAIFVKAWPRKITQMEFDHMNGLDQKRIAIMIANWHESDVLERMVAGNIKNIDYQNYEILLGVYPNDYETKKVALAAEKKYRNVRVIVNEMNGPTSKGQMINQMVKFVDTYNRSFRSRPYDLVITHDAEDVIHRYALKLINLRSLECDFIQIPVFSLETPLSKLTAGIYMDEFTDSHTKNLLVRDHYNAGVPSAGVGTAVSRSAITRLLEFQNGYFLKENTLTEDYFLGLTCYDLNIKARFIAEYFEYVDVKTGELKRDYVATREFFPQKVKASVKQKTRWIMGICLQSFEQENRKSKNLVGAYFLWRDRKGLWSAPLFVSTLIFTVYFLGSYLINGVWPTTDYEPYNDVLVFLMWTNLVVAVLRIVERFVLVSKVYNLATASLVPVRWIVSNFINNYATFNAVFQWSRSKIRGEVPKWAKTDHIIPVGFGMESYDFAENTLPLSTTPLPYTTSNRDLNI